MKTLAAAAALGLLAVSAQAGGSEPMMEPVVIADDAAQTSSSAGLVLGLMTVILFGTALASN
ncbi:ferrochelatase [Thalassococcus sp. CAU 1522]|uniref:Ferrochelatase n=1 Tax=Thalassococcus arenae TaxID=2851652 RepID=A0ABS6N996_9RHOB|nr:ferrochelatase [Thalassococcus arenae]MBV2360591.1 ferrochelatase [Thalassococcus arenae]